MQRITSVARADELVDRFLNGGQAVRIVTLSDPSRRRGTFVRRATSYFGGDGRVREIRTVTRAVEHLLVLEEARRCAGGC